jgi:transforming growth factor-beta-induced protein
MARKLTTVLAALVLVAGSASAQMYASPAAAAMATRDLSTLVAAVQAADLTSVLSNETANLTVLAPTNTAFAEAVAALDIAPADLLASSYLTPVLTYHVIPGAAKAADLMDGMTLTTLEGQPLTVSIMDGNVIFSGPVNNATVLMADIEAGNSVVHVIDSVLLPNLDTAPMGAPASGPALATALQTYMAGLAPAPMAASN